jgi:Leucine-rich repeat (LRR) protein
MLTFAGHRYQALPDLLTWTDAKAKAEQMGGHLATITTREECDWIETNVIAKGTKGLGLWIGATNDGIPKQWRWVTGEPFDFTYWNSGEPGNTPAEIGVLFGTNDNGVAGWLDIRDNGMGKIDRRAGLLVEWDDAATPIKMSVASSGPAPGAINLLEGIDPARDTVEGEWVMKNGELNCDHGNGFARLAFNVPVPREYDFRIRFTRKNGNKAVSQHVVLPDGRDIMWLMGGFNNDVFAWEMINGKGGNANPSAIKMGVENGRRYDCLVKVRKDRLQVELDGRTISDQEIWTGKLGVFDRWTFPDPKKLGIGCQVPTVFHSAELIPFSDPALATTSAPSTMPAAAASAAPPPPPSPSPADPRVAQLQSGFKARYDTDVQNPYDASVNSLNQSYLANGIARARSAAQQRGALDEVTALDTEKTRVSSHAPLPASDDDTLPASLKTLRGTYRTELGKIDASRAKAAGPLYDLYLGALDSYIAELAKGNKTDEAQRVQALRDEVAAQKSAVMETSGAPATETAAATGASSPPSSPPRTTATVKSANSAAAGPPLPIPPEALTPPKKAEHSRELAEWTLIKCRGRLYTGEGQQTKRYAAPNPSTPLSPEDLPKGSFNMTLLDSGNSNRAPVDTNWVEGETALEELTLWQVDFASPLALRGMKKLNALRIRGSASALPDEQMLLWPPLPALKQLDIQGAFGNTGLRVICERCPEISRLVIQARLTDGGLAPLQRLKNLNYFEMNGGSLPVGDLGLLASLPKLEKITLSGVTLGSADFSSLANLTELSVFNSKLSESDVKSLGSLKKLTNLRFGGNQLTDASLPVLATLPKLQNLELNGNPISGSTFAGLAGMKSLTRLSLINTKISDDTLATLPPMPALADLRIQDNASIGDGAAPAIGKHRSISKLDVGTTGMGDAGLEVLCNELPNLKEFYFYNTKVTDAGLTALKRLKKIEHLSFGDTALTDASVEHLKKITTLRSIELRNTQISAKAVAELQKALPQCQISAN